MPNPKYTNFNEMMGKWLVHTLWIWLPFHALIRLTRDVIKKHSKDE